MKKITSLLICFIILLTVPLTFTALNASENSSQSYLEKIHFYFPTIVTNDVSSRTINNKISYARIYSNADLEHAINNMLLTYEEGNDDDIVYMTIEFESNYFNTEEFLSFSDEAQEIKTLDEMRDFRRRVNSFSKEYHQAENEKNLKALPQLDYQKISVVDYAPYVKLEFNSENINSNKLIKVAEIKNVKSISLDPGKEYTDTSISFEASMKALEAFDFISNNTYTGEGIKIGIFEAATVCNTEDSNLVNIDITVDNRNAPIGEHATIVTSIIAKMAPDASFYVSAFHTNEGLQWFIDNGCDLINCSYAEYGNTKDVNGVYSNSVSGYRNNIDGLMDYQIKAHFLTVVTAASNKNTNNLSDTYNPNGEVRSPGLAYNAITVGGLQQTGTLIKRLQHCDGASYVSTAVNAKPEISTMFDLVVPGHENVAGGTSWSAPQVTGAIALLLEAKGASLAVQPSAIKALLIATASETYDYSEDCGYFDDKVGAGVLNVDRLINDSDHIGFSIVRTSDYANSYIYSKTISLSWYQELQVSLAWFANMNEGLNSFCVTNYDLRIYNEDGELVAQSNLDTKSAVELIRFDVPRSGNYTIYIYQIGDKPSQISQDTVALVYDIF